MSTKETKSTNIVWHNATITRELRETQNRNVTPHGDFYEIFRDASLETCESRDVKGLYAKARAGEIPYFTGISSPYEAPNKPELVINTGENSIEECVDQVINQLVEHGVIKTYAGPAAVSIDIT